MPALNIFADSRIDDKDVGHVEELTFVHGDTRYEVKGGGLQESLSIFNSFNRGCVCDSSVSGTNVNGGFALEYGCIIIKSPNDCLESIIVSVSSLNGSSIISGCLNGSNSCCIFLGSLPRLVISCYNSSQSRVNASRNRTFYSLSLSYGL